MELNNQNHRHKYPFNKKNVTITGLFAVKKTYIFAICAYSTYVVFIILQESWGKNDLEQKSMLNHFALEKEIRKVGNTTSMMASRQGAGFISRIGDSNVSDIADSDANSFSSEGTSEENRTEILTKKNQQEAKDEERPYLTMYGEHRVKPALEELPKWLYDYFAWHRNQILNAHGGTKYLVVTCLGGDRCGGFSDRLRGLPSMLFVASRVDRVLCIYWSRPFPLDLFLRSPSGGMDWSCPDAFQAIVKKDSRSNQGQSFHHNTLYSGIKSGMEGNRAIESIITAIKANTDQFTSINFLNQDFIKINNANNVFNAYSYKEQMPVASKWFHVDLVEHIYRVVFEPNDEIARRINTTTTRFRLVENNYTAVHVRARYPTGRLKQILGNDKGAHIDKGSQQPPFKGRYKQYLVDIAKNALECGIQLDEDKTKIFFSSDSIDLTNFISSNPIQLGNKSVLYHPVGIDGREEIKHLDTTEHFTSHIEYYPIIEDLLILGGAQCVSFGIGSFGAFGAGLAGNKCRAIHRDYKGKPEKCPNSRGIRSIENITDNHLIFEEKLSDTNNGRIAVIV